MRAVADQCMVHECAQIVGAAVGGGVLLLAIGVGVAVAVCAAKKSKSTKLIRPNSPSTEGNEEDESDDDVQGNTTQRRASVTKVVIERSCSNHSVLVCDLRTGSATLSICTCSFMRLSSFVNMYMNMYNCTLSR